MADDTKSCLICLSIFLIICCSINIILASVQLGKQKGYGYDELLSMLDNNQLLLEINQKKCDEYIKDIKSKKNISKAKTIITLIYNSIALLFIVIRIKNLRVNCLFDILISVYLMAGFIIELVIVSLSLSYYNQTDYDSDNFKKCNIFNDTLLISEEIFEEAFIESQWVIKIDKGIISIVCIYFIPIFGYSISLLCKLCDHPYELDCFNHNFCCAKCYGNDYESLKKENEYLRRRNDELVLENNSLKRLNEEANNSISERKKIEDEIKIIDTNDFKNKFHEKKFLEENADLKAKIIDYENQLTQLKTYINNQAIEIKNLKDSSLENSKQKEMKYILKKKEELQMKAIEFYLKEEKEKDFKNNNNQSFLKILLLKEINEKYGLFLDLENFKKIGLYYIKSRLTEHLTDKKNLKLLSDPVIQKDGITLERANVIQGNEFVENKLVSKIIEILNKKKDFEMIDFITIKILLKNVKTNNFYDNPVVISNGNNIGETIESNDNDIQNYKNLLIKNIINDLRDLFEDNFFDFQGLDNEDMKKFVDYNNIMVINFMSGDSVINEGIKCLKTDIFAEVEEKLYKIYEEYRGTNNLFLHAGNAVLRFKTIEENNIKNSDKVIMQVV